MGSYHKTQTDGGISGTNNEASKHPGESATADHTYAAYPPEYLEPDLPESAEIHHMEEHSDDACSGDEGSMYSPPNSSEHTDTEDGNDSEDGSSNSAEERKLIIFESELDKLFRFCQQCGSIVATKTKYFKGSMVKVKTTCLQGHSNTWQSQPSINGKATGNLLIPAAILFSGNTFTHIETFAKFLQLQFISSSHYYKIQEKHLLPVINNKWESGQAEIIQQVTQVNHVDICGDGRCDSPGHSAKYGTYTMIDESTKKVLDFSVVQVTEVTSSNAMEFEGCKRTLNFVLGKEIPVRCLTTDRHTTITARIRSDYPSVKHQYDVWHLSKWVTKKLTKKAKKKQFEELMPWIQSTVSQIICGGVRQPVVVMLIGFERCGYLCFITLSTSIDGQAINCLRSVHILQCQKEKESALNG